MVHIVRTNRQKKESYKTYTVGLERTRLFSSKGDFWNDNQNTPEVKNTIQYERNDESFNRKTENY